MCGPCTQPGSSDRSGSPEVLPALYTGGASQLLLHHPLTKDPLSCLLWLEETSDSLFALPEASLFLLVIVIWKPGLFPAGDITIISAPSCSEIMFLHLSKDWSIRFLFVVFSLLNHSNLLWLNEEECDHCIFNTPVHPEAPQLFQISGQMSWFLSADPQLSLWLVSSCTREVQCSPPRLTKLAMGFLSGGFSRREQINSEHKESLQNSPLSPSP